MNGEGADSHLPAGESASPAADGFRALAGWMQEIAPFGIFTTDVDLKIRSWNNWMVVHSGLNGDQVIGREVGEVYPDLEDRRAIDRFRRAIAGEISVMSTALHKHLLPLPSTVSDGAPEHMLQTARIAPLRDHGQVIGTIIIIEDVTQREVQANILRRQQELDRLLSASLATLLQADDPAQEIGTIFANMSPALGLDAYVCYLLSADGKTLQLKLAGGFSPRQREIISTVSLLAEDERTLLGVASGRAVNLSSHANALRSLGLRGLCSFPLAVGNRLLGLVSFGSYQRDAIASADVNVLSRIARYVTIALDRAIRERETLAASRAKDDFLAALSHELRTPLNPVLLLASDGAANSEFSAAARETFRIIEKNALLEARLIDDLLDLTRIEHGKLRLERQIFDVNSALKDALATVASDAAERDLSIHVDLKAQDTALIGDSGRLQQVFWNVLKNAVKFTPVGGRVFVSTYCATEAGEVVIQVSDTGIGMEPHELSRVFNAFSQGDHADHGQAHRFGGLGLGLAITRKLVELHSGRIEATSRGKNQGSTFSIHLPIAVKAGASEEDVADPFGSIESPDSSAGQSSRICILLVEDHESTRIPLTRLLARKGYQVVAVSSAAEALEAVSKAKFDLVLSDIGLPDMDGFELMKMLRERHALKGIALTGYGMEADISRGNDAGFVAHLTKPISVKVLERALAVALSAQGSLENSKVSP